MTGLEFAKEQGHSFERIPWIGEIGIMDALILAKQKELGGHIVTGDQHFKDIKAVEFLG